MMGVSVVIPAYNEELYISDTLSELIRVLSDKIEFEIILIDNCSCDKTQSLAREFNCVDILSLPKKVTVSQARNIGWQASKYETIAFIDADIIVTEKWADQLVEFSKDLLVCVTGSKVGLSRNPSKLEVNWFGSMRMKTTEKYINSGNLITKRKVLETLLGFDAALITGEDVDFSVRAKNRGFPVIDNPNFAVYHEGYPKNIKQFSAREVWHGQGDFKSFKTFFSSMVAMSSVAIVALIIVSVIGVIFGVSELCFLSISLIILFILFFSVRKFHIRGIVGLGHIFFLTLLYFVCRFCSLFRRAKL